MPAPPQPQAFAQWLDLSQAADTSCCLQATVVARGLWRLSIVPPRQPIRQNNLLATSSALGLAGLARTGRLHSAAVGDIVVL